MCLRALRLRFRSRTNLRLSLAFCASLFALPYATAQSYAIVDLGTNISPTSINSYGQIAGGEINGHAFIYSDGNFQDIGTLGGMRSDGNSISDGGFVAGASRTEAGMLHAFFFDGTSMQDLGTITGANANSYANGVNANGQVVGASELTSDGNAHAFLYRDGVMQDLGTFGGANSQASGINSFGQIVGQADFSSGFAHAFLYTDGTMQDLGTLDGGHMSSAAAVNDAGQITGSSDQAGTSAPHAFFYDGSSMQDLGTLGGGISVGRALNSWGEVVGWSQVAGDPAVIHAFFFDGSTLLDLNDLVDPSLGWELRQATGINDAGQIIGVGYINGEQHGFLLVPNN